MLARREGKKGIYENVQSSLAKLQLEGAEGLVVQGEVIIAQ